jgi:hypothetical protein
MAQEMMNPYYYYHLLSLLHLLWVAGYYRLVQVVDLQVEVLQDYQKQFVLPRAEVDYQVVADYQVGVLYQVVADYQVGEVEGQGVAVEQDHSIVFL